MDVDCPYRCRINHCAIVAVCRVVVVYQTQSSTTESSPEPRPSTYPQGHNQEGEDGVVVTLSVFDWIEVRPRPVYEHGGEGANGEGKEPEQESFHVVDLQHPGTLPVEAESDVESATDGRSPNSLLSPETGAGFSQPSRTQRVSRLGLQLAVHNQRKRARRRRPCRPLARGRPAFRQSPLHQLLPSLLAPPPIFSDVELHAQSPLPDRRVVSTPLICQQAP